MEVVDIIPKDIEIVVSFSPEDVRILLNAFDIMTMQYDSTDSIHQQYKEVYEKFYSMLENIEKGLNNGREIRF